MLGNIISIVRELLRHLARRSAASDYYQLMDDLSQVQTGRKFTRDEMNE